MKKIDSLRTIGLLIIYAVGLMSFGSCSGDEEKDEEIFELSPPVVNTATNVTMSSFLATWSKVPGADHYEVDVALDEDFSEFLNGYEAIQERSVELNVKFLEANTIYYVRVRTSIDEELSVNSNVITATTESEPGPEPPEPTTPLKEAAGFNVGNIVQASRLSGQYQTILSSEFDQITAEYEMKMNIMYPSEGNYDYSKGDAIVDFAVDNGLEVHGHALVWHNATPSWVENFSGTDAEFEIMVEDFVKTTVERYKGKVRSWDVVNEAFQDGGSSPLRTSVFQQKMGDDFMAKCFQWAREADPDLLLFYNDYNMIYDATKLQSVLDMVDDFQDRGIPIDGVGFQMHISYNSPSKSQMAAAAKKITDRGLLLHFAELDVRANPDNSMSSLTVQREEEQATKVREVVEVYNAIPEANKFALTIWGVKDNDSWLMDFWGHIDWPLLWDSNFELKKAHTGFLEGLE
ncbi:MAG: endo-1,4-beta-xylanase [Reichenbachiella sp.]